MRRKPQKPRETLIDSSYRRRPVSNALNDADSGLRQNDGEGINQRFPGCKINRLVVCGLLFLPPLLAHAELPTARQAELMHLLEQDCGACHGLTRKGGLGPSLLPDALSDKPNALLIQTVLEGRPGTPMPPWRPFLNEEEAQWLIQTLRSGDGL